MIVCNQEFTEQIIEQIQKTVDKEPGLSRVALSRQVCKRLGWRRANGKLKEMSCRAALLKMDRSGIIRLPPAAQRPPGSSQKRRNPAITVTVQSITCSFSKLGTIELVKIGSADSKASRIWNALMGQYHYLGSGPLCGAQIRYLIKSARHGWLGGLAFSAAAWSLKRRDEWIGWSVEERQRQLEKVVCNSRFLILPQVKVKHLASHVLAMSSKQVRRDWQEHYGYEPVLLETFVESRRFQGTCYRAANWIHIGKTQGRGRNDRGCEKKAGVKDIYIYPLRKDARRVLCEGRRSAPASVKAPADWAEEELGATKLGEKRLEKRLLMIARDFYARPQANIPQACQSRAKSKATYRFFKNRKVGMEKILASHREATVARMAKETVVLAVQDTTTLNYTAHPATEGLGLIGYRKNGGMGLIVHDTMAFDVKGTPLGLLDVQCWKRSPEDFGKKHHRKSKAISEKESYKWLKSFQQTAAAQEQCRHTKIVSVGDREADIYELFQLTLKNAKGPKLLVRAEQNRLLAEGQGKLWENVAQQASSGTYKVCVGRKGSRPAREVELEVRFAEVRLQPPQSKKQLGELTIYAILGKESGVVETDKALEWMLLSTDPVRSFAEAVEKLGWYSQRWGIEIYHKTLKSGCQIEKRQLVTADRIEACLAVDMIVAWRILHLTRLGRETPDVPCTVFFEDAEYKALVMYKRQDGNPPAETPHLREAIHMVASLGGFLGRKGDGEPGTKSLWLGLQRLDDITAAWKVMAATFAPHLLCPYPE